MTPQSITTLMIDLDTEDPLDMGQFSIDKADARQLMANHFCTLDQQLIAHGLDAEARLEMMAAIAAHAMTENMILHLGQLCTAAGQNEFRAWMRRHGLG